MNRASTTAFPLNGLFGINAASRLAALLGGMLLGAAALAAEPPATGGVAGVQPVFATVGKTVITQEYFDAAFAAAARAKFYHGQPADSVIALLQREVGDKLITRTLLLSEAKRRKMKPDAKNIKQKLAQHEQRYRDNPQWQQDRTQALPLITRQLREESLLDRLEKRVRKVPAPSEKQLRDYYAAHQDKFTAPEQQRVSLILLKVDPSSPNEVWQAAQDAGKDLTKRLSAGADFAELARDYSDDSSAEAGGDMGYLHTGMLAEAAQETVNKLKPGETSDPITLMEGVTILRLTDRVPPKLNSFDEAKERVRSLWLAEQSELAWNSLIAKLKKNTPIRINELRYLPLPDAAAKPDSKN